jgi:hypothetical protein
MYPHFADASPYLRLRKCLENMSLGVWRDLKIRLKILFFPRGLQKSCRANVGANGQDESD